MATISNHVKLYLPHIRNCPGFEFLSKFNTKRNIHDESFIRETLYNLHKKSLVSLSVTGPNDYNKFSTNKPYKPIQFISKFMEINSASSTKFPISVLKYRRYEFKNFSNTSGITA